MQAEQHTQKDAALAEVERLIRDRLPATRADQAVRFAHQYYERVPLEEIRQESAETLAAVALNFLRFARQRLPGELLMRVYNPTEEEHGWESPHTIIEMVNDDMPFLVDSSSLTLAENHQVSHLVVHPVMRIKRDEGGHILKVLERGQNQEGQAESLIHLQINRETDPEELERLKSHLVAALSDARRAVEDWQAIRRKVTAIADVLPEFSPQAEDAMLEEEQAFLRWLADDHFTFLGYREYEVVSEQGADRLNIVKGTGLGILREGEDTVHSKPAANLRGESEAQANDYDPLIITKTNARSTVHRVGYMDYIGILAFDEDGNVLGERRILGLFTSNAYNRSVADTPLVRDKARNVLSRSGLRPGSHAWKSLVHILETLPRDELFQAHTDDLYDLSIGILNLQERHRTRLFIRRDRFGRFYSCMVFIPRDRFNTENREKIQQILSEALNGERMDYVVQVSESAMARLLVIIRPESGRQPEYDEEEIEQRIVAAIRSWHDELESILVEKFGEEKGLQWLQRYGKAFPAAYIEDVTPWVASFDVENAAHLKDVHDLRMSLYRPREEGMGLLRFKVFKYDKPIPLSDVLPTLENLGLRIVSERPYELNLADGSSLWVQDFDMVFSSGGDLDIDSVRDDFQDAFERIYRGDAESDGFNRLVLGSHLTWRQVVILRAYGRYLLQTGMPFSQAYMESTLSKHPILTRLLVEQFGALFDPERQPPSEKKRARAKAELGQIFERLIAVQEPAVDEVLAEFLDEVVQVRDKPRDHQGQIIRRAILRGLEAVRSLDEDRIIRAYCETIAATLRTNYYCHGASGDLREFISFKLDSGKVPNLPRPRPFREIWVFSPRVEGIHLRGGMVARGGLRWSDRREDFRTEVLGLMKAQNVKNTMIVPVGAKGGFVVKRLPETQDRDVIMAEVVYAYRSFINGLLDITDNIVEDEIVPPEETIRRDGDDPYLVVAADKGTATFSDIANSVAGEHDFWLGDAFASGGSAGYDHKGMGITAKGAWESVKRHFMELGKDIQNEDFTVVGIGDMSGDVFGNGMLLSRHIRLQAAFNHLHIFLDPDPDPETSFEERQRLFNMGRSSWSDYNEELISKGGGIFSRQAKNVELSEEVQTWLGVEESVMTPHALIRELLKAPVDLLWNGGIGTYVKAVSESNADVGDLANNPLRVNGKDLRCRVVGEGGNLGLTQLGRIEFAQHGGRINTDFIDNSAGVDTSDHEVNIKILLNLAIKAGKLDLESRNELLASMTDEVEALVLRSNYLQTQAISMMERFAGARVGAKSHFISVLEQEGILDRDLEYLPDDEEMTERRNKELGLYRPEIAVLLSYSKITLYQQLLASNIPEDDYLARELVSYFPTPLHQDYAKLMQEHRLRREIIATMVTNSMVNRMGVSFAMRMQEDTGATPAEVAKAYTIAREVFDARDFWGQVEALDNKVPAALQIDALLAIWNLLRQATRWLLGSPRRRFRIETQVDRFRPGIQKLKSILADADSRAELEQVNTGAERYIEAGFPSGLAEQISMLSPLYPALDIVDEAISRNLSVMSVARVYYRLGSAMRLKWLRQQVESLPVDGQWHANARGNLRDELYSQHRALTGRILKRSEGLDKPVEAWLERNRPSVERTLNMLDDMRNLPQMDYATIGVAIRALEQLVMASD